MFVPPSWFVGCDGRSGRAPEQVIAQRDARFVQPDLAHAAAGPGVGHDVHVRRGQVAATFGLGRGQLVTARRAVALLVRRADGHVQRARDLLHVQRVREHAIQARVHPERHLTQTSRTTALLDLGVLVVGLDDGAQLVHTFDGVELRDPAALELEGDALDPLAREHDGQVHEDLALDRTRVGRGEDLAVREVASTVADDDLLTFDAQTELQLATIRVIGDDAHPAALRHQVMQWLHNRRHLTVVGGAGPHEQLGVGLQAHALTRGVSRRGEERDNPWFGQPHLHQRLRGPGNGLGPVLGPVPEQFGPLRAEHLHVLTHLGVARHQPVGHLRDLVLGAVESHLAPPGLAAVAVRRHQVQVGQTTSRGHHLLQDHQQRQADGLALEHDPLVGLDPAQSVVEQVSCPDPQILFRNLDVTHLTISLPLLGVAKNHTFNTNIEGPKSPPLRLSYYYFLGFCQYKKAPGQIPRGH